MRLVCACFLLVHMFPFAALAHGYGASLERSVGEYWIDIGYDPSQLVGGERMVFDFNLAERVATSTFIEFDSVWVRLHLEGKTFLATGVAQADVGPTTLLLLLPQDAEGDLGVSVRYQRNGESFVESEFTIPVASYTDPYWWWPYIGIIAAAVLGAAGVMLAARARVRGAGERDSIAA